MKALITGASSGIGREMAYALSRRGIELILCSRNENALHDLSKKLPVSSRVIALDLSSEESCKQLYEQTREESIDILINNAGFGSFGSFLENSIETDLEQIKLNICAPQILTKYFLKDFKDKKTPTYILNVSSMAGFFPGPLFATYYASKNYLSALSAGIAEELRRENSLVSISLLCPGPVPTNFGTRAGVSFDLNFGSIPAHEVAEFAIQGMFSRKLYLIPGKLFKVLLLISRILPRKLIAKIVAHCQCSKNIVNTQINPNSPDSSSRQQKDG